MPYDPSADDPFRQWVANWKPGQPAGAMPAPVGEVNPGPLVGAENTTLSPQFQQPNLQSVDPFYQWVKNWKPVPIPPEADNRPNTERFGFTPAKPGSELPNYTQETPGQEAQRLIGEYAQAQAGANPSAFYQNVSSPLMRAGLSVYGPGLRPFFGDEAQRQAQVLGQAEEIAAPGEGGHQLRGILSSGAQMAANLGIAHLSKTGTAGVAVLNGIQQADQSFTQARDSGLDDKQALRHAAIMGGLETGITLLANKFMPTGEKLGLSTLKGEFASGGMKAAIGDVLKSILGENVEEVVTNFSQKAVEKINGVDRKEWTLDEAGQLLKDTLIQTTATVAILGGGKIGTTAYRQAQAANQRLSDLHLQMMQNRLNVSAEQQAQEQAGVHTMQAKAAQFVDTWAKTDPEALARLAAVTNPSRSAFADALGMKRNDVPGNAEFRAAAIQQAKQLMGNQAEADFNLQHGTLPGQAMPPPTRMTGLPPERNGPLPNVQTKNTGAQFTVPQPPGAPQQTAAPVGEPNQSVTGPQQPSLFDVTHTGQHGQAFDERQSVTGQPAPPPPAAPAQQEIRWDAGIKYHGLKKAIEEAAAKFGLDPAVVRHYAEGEYQQKLNEWELKKEIWSAFGLSKKGRKQLINDDEDKVRGAGNIGYDKLLQEFQNRHPEASEDFIKETLKEKPERSFPKTPASIVDEVASKVADERERLQNYQEPPPPPGYKSWDEVPFMPGGKYAMMPAANAPSARSVPTGANASSPGVNPVPTSTTKATGAELVRLRKVAESIDKVKQYFSGRKGSVRSGRTLPGARGQYDITTGATRIGDAGDVVAAAHEAGHAITENANVLQGITPPMQAELVNLGHTLYQGHGLPGRGYLKEGYSEFLRMYFTDPNDAKTAAPEFFKHYDAAVNANPKGAKLVRQAQALAEHWFRTMGGPERVRAQRENPHSFDNFVKQGLQKLSKFFTRQNLEDVAAPLGDVERIAQEITGRTIAPGQSPHRTYLADRNRASGVINAFINDGQFMPDAPHHKQGPALSEILSPLKQGNRYDQFSDYVYGLFAVESWRHNLNPGVTLDDAAATVRHYDSPEFQKMARDLQDWNRTLNAHIATFDPTMADAFSAAETKYGFYLPVKRMMAEDELRGTLGGQSGAGGMKTGRITRERKGGGQAVKDPIPQLIADKYSQLQRAMQRNVMNKLLTLIYDQHNGKFLQAHSHLVEETTGLPQDPADFRWTTTTRGGQKIVRTFAIQPELRTVLEGMEPAQLRGALGLIFSMPTKIAKAGWIGLSPAYAVRNMMRDIHAMLVKAPGDASLARRAQMLPQYFATIGRGIAGKDNGWMTTAKQMGLGEALLLSEHTPNPTRIVSQLSKGIVWGEPGTWVDTVLKGYDWFKGKMQSPEFAARVTMMRVKAEQLGWKPGQALDPDTAVELALAFKQPMGDYGAKGELFRTLDQIFPLASVPITYGRSFAQAFKRNPKMVTLTSLATLTVPTILLWLRNKDEEWYKELPPYEKYSKLYMAFPEFNTGLLWSRNSEEGQLFSAIPEALLNLVYQQDPKHATDLAQYMLGQAMPSLPPAVSELTDQAANKKQSLAALFGARGGGPIVPEREGISKRAPAEQFTDETSETAKAIGRGTGLSPLRLEHAAETLSGGLTKRLTKTVEGATGIKPATREQQLSDLPGAGAFFPSGGLTGNRPEPVDRLYRLAEELQQRQHSVSQPETDAEREKRLVVEAGARAASALLRLRQRAQTVQERQDLMRRVSEIAREAESGSGDKQVFHGIAQAALYQGEQDPDKRSRMLLNRLDDLTHQKPMLGHSGVTRSNLEARRQAYADALQTAQTFLKESGVDRKEAFEQYRQAVVKGIGPDKAFQVRSIDARGRKLRLIRRELGI